MMKIQKYLKPNISTRRKFIQRLALYGCLLFILIAVIFLSFSNANVGEGLTRWEFDLMPLLFLTPMSAISGFMSALFLKRFDNLCVRKKHSHREKLVKLLSMNKFTDAFNLINESDDKIITRYTKELTEHTKILQHEVDSDSDGSSNVDGNKIKLKDIDIYNAHWGYGRAGLVSIGILFTFVGVYRVMINLGKSSQPVLQDLFSGAGEALSSTIVGAGFGCIVLIYFLTLTMMKNRMIETEKAFFYNIGLEVD